MDLNQFINNGQSEYEGDCPWKSILFLVTFLFITFIFFLMNP